MPVITESGWTLGELIDHAYFLADEEPNVVFRESDIIRLLNMGFRKVTDLIGYPLVRATTYTEVGVSDYNLVNAVYDGSENAEVESVLLYGEDDSLVATLARTAFDNDPETDVGVPEKYAVDGDTVFIYPPPDAEYTLKVSYRTFADKVTDKTEIPPLSFDAQEAAVFYAVWQMKLKDDQVAQSDRWRSAYDEKARKLGSPRTGVYKPGTR